MLQSRSNRKEREKEMERMSHNFNMGVREWVGTAVMFSTRILEVLCTSICRDAGYPDWDASWLPSVPPSKHRDCLDLHQDRFLLHVLQVVIYLQFYRLTLYRLASQSVIKIQLLSKYDVNIASNCTLEPSDLVFSFSSEE
jgi:hypothetical protein